MTRYEAFGEIALILITLLATVGAATIGALAIETLRRIKTGRWSAWLVDGPGDLSELDRRDGLR